MLHRTGHTAIVHIFIYMIRYICICPFYERKCKLPTWYGYHGTTCKARVSSSACLTSMLRASGSLENIVTPFDENVSVSIWLAHIQMSSKMLKPPYQYLIIYIFAYHANYILVLVLEFQGSLRSCAWIRESMRIPKQPKTTSRIFWSLESTPSRGDCGTIRNHCVNGDFVALISLEENFKNNYCQFHIPSKTSHT